MTPEARAEYIVSCIREAGSMYPQDARAFLADHDAHLRSVVLAEAKFETVAWLVKKAAEQRMWDAGVLASKVDRGAVRAFIGTAHYRDALDAHRTEVLTEAAAKADEIAAAMKQGDETWASRAGWACASVAAALRGMAADGKDTSGQVPAGESTQPAPPVQVWHVFDEDTGQPLPPLFTTQATAEQGTIDRYQAGGEYSPDYSWRPHEDGARELLAGGDPVGIYLTPVTVHGDTATPPAPDFFQPGRVYARRRWSFHCLAVAPSPTTGLICALGYLTRTDGTCTAHALDQDDWEHQGWTEVPEGGGSR